MFLVKQYSPTPVLGSANGLLQLFICLSRAFGPVIARYGRIFLIIATWLTTPFHSFVAPFFPSRSPKASFRDTFGQSFSVYSRRVVR